MTDNGVWITRGFDDFRAGTFGNGGQNLYVSRAGVLQRIFHFDFNHDGYLDVVFANSQDHCENPPSYVYRDPLGKAERIEIPSDGAWSGLCADLNGDGYDDLVIAMLYDGVSHQRNARIFYGSEEGFSEKRMRLKPDRRTVEEKPRTVDAELTEAESLEAAVQDRIGLRILKRHFDEVQVRITRAP